MVVLILQAGCGQKDYEERLQRSRVFYEYLQTVQEALAPGEWSRVDVGMSMRLPKPFLAPLAGPKTHKDKDGKVVSEPDPRQKNVLRTPLPGLVDAWEAALDSPDGEPNAWIYVLSNHERILDVDTKGALKPEEFLIDLENELMRFFQVTVPEGETSRMGDNVRFRQAIPAQNSNRAQFTTPKDYTVIRFVPDGESNKIDLQGVVYERKAGRVQVALLILTPKSTSAAFRQRMDIALETFELNEVIPKKSRPATPGGTPSTGTQAPATSGF